MNKRKKGSKQSKYPRVAIEPTAYRLVSGAHSALGISRCVLLSKLVYQFMQDMIDQIEGRIPDKILSPEQKVWNEIIVRRRPVRGYDEPKRKRG